MTDWLVNLLSSYLFLLSAPALSGPGRLTEEWKWVERPETRKICELRLFLHITKLSRCVALRQYPRELTLFHVIRFLLKISYIYIFLPSFYLLPFLSYPYTGCESFFALNLLTKIVHFLSIQAGFRNMQSATCPDDPLKLGAWLVHPPGRSFRRYHGTAYEHPLLARPSGSLARMN